MLRLLPHGEALLYGNSHMLKLSLNSPGVEAHAAAVTLKDSDEV